MNTDEYNYYKNTGFRNTRNRKRILILDVDDTGANDTHLGSGDEFNIELFEPLIIDKQSEVYLDNFISFGGNISNIPENSGFCLKINEFNINSNVASSSHSNNMFNSIIIPNEHNSVSNNHSVVLHKAKKFNYICDINPGKIGRLSGRITNLKGDPAFHGTITTNNFTYALTGISTFLSTGFPIANNQAFTNISIDGSALSPAVTGNFLAHHENTADTLHFATNVALTASQFENNDGDIMFVGTDIKVDNDVGDNKNPNLSLLGGTGARFIAEFSIIARE
jgi:hypothetical protein